MNANTLYLYLFVVLLLGLLSCESGRDHHSSHKEKDSAGTITLLSATGKVAGGAYFSKDSHGNPLLCWTEETAQEDEFMLRYAKFDSRRNQFGTPVDVMPSRGTRLHSESMNKMAVKADGTLVAVYAVKHPTPANRFAGSIFYTLSADQGKTWSKPAYLHSDTLPDYGRGYFDLELLPDGEIGAVWLDGRFGEEDTGSALFFAKTEPGKGFDKDWQIGESTCECCRTDLFVDNMGGIHVAYRAILFPSALSGQQVRDMVHRVSHDGGQTFSAARRISADNWAIEGCPHTGPSLAANQDGLHTVWFTAGGDQGIFYANSKDNGQTFSTRAKMSGTARYPQVCTLRSGAIAMVWQDEKPMEGAAKKVASTQSHAHGNSQSNGRGTSIVLRLVDSEGVTTTSNISHGEAEASNPAVIPVKGIDIAVAWTQENEEGSGIYYTIVSP